MLTLLDRPNTKPFEVDPQFLSSHLEEMVDRTISDLTSEFLVLPKGDGFSEYPDFREAFEVLKRHTDGFINLSESNVLSALMENSRVFGVIRAILGLTASEWAELARSERGSDVDQNAARQLDRNTRIDPELIRRASEKASARKTQGSGRTKLLERLDSLISVAIEYIRKGAPDEIPGMIHRLAKFDTAHGASSVNYAAMENVPYAVLLYERYLGRPLAGHRDAVSELVGEAMENAIEDRLRTAGISYRKTKRAERIPGFGQAPDFCIPDEIAPVVIIEAKITSDDGTARDKVTRIVHLVTQRNAHLSRHEKRHYEVVACIDGRGFRQRREDMRKMLLALEGKVFTTATLDHLIANTRLREFVTS